MRWTREDQSCCTSFNPLLYSEVSKHFHRGFIDMFQRSNSQNTVTLILSFVTCYPSFMSRNSVSIMTHIFRNRPQYFLTWLISFFKELVITSAVVLTHFCSGELPRQARQAMFGSCLDFWFQYILIRNNWSENLG